MARRPKTALVQLKIRMREPLRARLQKAAKASGISINREVVDRLERSFAQIDWAEAVIQNFQKSSDQEPADVHYDYVGPGEDAPSITRQLLDQMQSLNEQVAELRRQISPSKKA